MGCRGTRAQPDVDDTGYGQFASRLRGLLRDEAFQVFLQEEPYRYRTPKEFAALDLPDGLDPELAAELVAFARRMRGMPLLSTAAREDDAGAFWVVSPNMYGELFHLAVQVSAASELWGTLQPLIRRPEILRFLMRDIAAALQRDGVEVTPERLEVLVYADAAPRDARERLVTNALALVEEDGLLDGDSPAVLERLWGRLTQGAADVADHPRQRISVAEILGTDSPALPTLASLWERVSLTGQREIHPLMDVLFVSDMLFDAGPFERFNGLMEVVLRHALARRLAMPVLRRVPYSALRLDWELCINPQNYQAAFGKAAFKGTYGVDSTLVLRVALGNLSRGLDQLEGALAQLRAHDDARRMSVETDWRLNPRQKELLCNLIAHPERAVDARAYERDFEVAMSTAHTDLAALARLGLLVSETQGRKQVFWLAPG